MSYRITHDGVQRRTTKYWLEPQGEHERKHYDLVILMEAYCPKCKRTVFEWCGFRYKDGKLPSRKLKDKELELWLPRKNACLFKDEPLKKPDKDTKAKSYAGEYTQSVSRDPADSNYLERLERQLAAPKHKPEDVAA